MERKWQPAETAPVNKVVEYGYYFYESELHSGVFVVNHGILKMKFGIFSKVKRTFEGRRAMYWRELQPPPKE